MAAAAVKKPWIAWNMTEDEWIAAEKAADDAVNKEHAEAEEAMQKWFADNADQVAQVKEQMEADRIDKNKAKAFDKIDSRVAPTSFGFHRSRDLGHHCSSQWVPPSTLRNTHVKTESRDAGAST